jgi:hypothetical protein
MTAKLICLLVVCAALAGAAWSLATGYVFLVDGMFVVGICALTALIFILSRFEFGQKEIGSDSNKSHVLLRYYR